MAEDRVPVSPASRMNPRGDYQTLEQLRVVMGDKVNIIPLAEDAKHSYADLLESGGISTKNLLDTHVTMNTIGGGNPETSALAAMHQSGKMEMSKEQFIKTYKARVFDGMRYKIIDHFQDAQKAGKIDKWTGGGEKAPPFDLNLGNIMVSNDAISKVDDALSVWHDKTGGKVSPENLSAFTTEWSEWAANKNNNAYEVIDVEVGGVNVDKLDPEKAQKITQMREQWAKREADPEVMKKAWERGLAWKSLEFGEGLMPEKENLSWREIGEPGTEKVWKLQQEGRPEIFTDKNTGEEFTKVYHPEEGEVRGGSHSRRSTL